jgi:hypothetical protein
MSTIVSNPSADRNEKIANAARILGRSVDRKKVFLAIYRGKKRIKTVSDIKQTSGLTNNVRVLQEGKKLASEDIVKQLPRKVSGKGETAYQKIDFYTQNKDEIIRLATDKKKLREYPTKSNPRVRVQVRQLQVSYPTNAVKIREVSIDDIDSFQRVRNQTNEVPSRVTLAEKEVKRGLKRIIGEKGKFPDWGGETNDLFTKLKLNGKRLTAAFALKGKGKKGILTPERMGKNGDQILRLFQSPAVIFLVQYNEQIAPSVLDVMRTMAIAKSVGSGERIYYGVINGSDTARLMLAYPTAFRHKL